MGLIDLVDRLIQERGSASILRDTLTLVREQAQKEITERDERIVQLIAQLQERDAQIQKLTTAMETCQGEAAVVHSKERLSAHQLTRDSRPHVLGHAELLLPRVAAYPPLSTHPVGQ